MNEPTSEQQRYWQGTNVWVTYADALDAQLDSFGLTAQQAAQQRRESETLEGALVLDVGCGTGRTTIQLATAVAEGSGAATGAGALGVDVSEPVVEVAVGRAAAEGVANVRFEVADAQSTDLRAVGSRAGLNSADGFDVVFSRFGVMFFADSVAAFANLLAAAKPGGVLAFVCWQPASANPWITTANRAAMQLVEFDPPVVDPFAFGEPSTVSSHLAAAGWHDVSFESRETDVTLMGGGSARSIVPALLELGPTRAALEKAADRDRLAPQVADAMVAALEPYERDGNVVMRGAAWVVTAAAPGG